VVSESRFVLIDPFAKSFLTGSLSIDRFLTKRFAHLSDIFYGDSAAVCMVEVVGSFNIF